MEADTKRILNGEEPSTYSVNRVTDTPKEFKAFARQFQLRNEEREQEGRRPLQTPYFIKDNPKFVGEQPRYGAVTGIKLGRTATKEAFKEYVDMPAPILTDEVAANTAEIAKSFGIKASPTPMTFIEANNGRANIFYGKTDAFAENCQACVAVHEARRRGLNVTALGYDYMEDSVSHCLGEHFEAIWQHAKTGNIPTPTKLLADTFETMLGKVAKETTAKGRYHIGINMPGNNGHVITAERLPNGKIIYYDAQSGAFLKLEEYADRDVEYFEVLKVDKLLLRHDLFKKIARWL